jgi:Tol biopolymer transport system component
MLEFTRYKSYYLLFIIVFIFPFSAFSNPVTNTAYLGQKPPADKAELFAPGIVSDGLNNRDIAISPDGSEIYYAVNMRNFDLSTILVVRRVNGIWAEPGVAPFATDWNFNYLEPAISPDGSKFFFVVSARDDKTNNDIWVMDREESGWGEPRKLGEKINTPVSETFPSITNDGTLFFSRRSDDPQVEYIYRSRYVDGEYAEPEKLPDNVNSGKTHFNAFVAPDESYLIVCIWGREDSLGSIDYYIVYRDKDDNWSAPINMGDKINTASGREYSPYVSRDGKFLFFMSTRLPEGNKPEEEDYSVAALRNIHNQPENGNSDIYWIDAGIIDQLRPDGF